MDERTFQREMTKASTFQELGDQADYWRGYQRGLRRNYHGGAFGTEEEHGLFLSMVDDVDEMRQETGRGYRDGLCQGLGISRAVGYTWGNTPDLIPVDWDAECPSDEAWTGACLAGGFSVDDEELGFGELTEEWNGHPAGSGILSGRTVEGHHFVVLEWEEMALVGHVPERHAGAEGGK